MSIKEKTEIRVNGMLLFNERNVYTYTQILIHLFAIIIKKTK